jgi:hypothetical protein
MKKVTIKNICIGSKFCQPDLATPHNQMMTVVDIEYNKDAGEPCRDMWGSVVWEKPFATIYAVGSLTGERKGYTVQSEDSDLSSWLTFIENPQERINLIYQNRRKEVISLAHRNLAEIVQKLQVINGYPAQLDKDQKMKNLIEYVAKAMLEVF